MFPTNVASQSDLFGQSRDDYFFFRPQAKESVAELSPVSFRPKGEIFSQQK